MIWNWPDAWPGSPRSNSACSSWFADGQLNKQIADQLGIQERTVKAHMSEIFAKLEVRNRTQAGVAFRRLELVDPATLV